MNYKLILGLLLVLTLVPLANAQTNKGEFINGSNLWITDVDVEVCNDGCDDDDDLSDGDSISEEGAPGGTVEFKIEVTNMFPEQGSDDVEIDSIEVKVTIEDIDDGDEIEEEIELDDLDAGDDDSGTVEFEIPLDVEEDEFTVLIEVDGDTDDNGSQEARMELTFEVQKEDNEVRITNLRVNPAEMQCSRAATVDVAVQNTGSEDEDSVVLEVSNDELGLNLRDTFDLSEDIDDDDNEFRKTTRFNVAANQPAGIYPIEAIVIFNDGRDRETETVELTVSACQTPVTPVTPPKDEDERDEEEEQEEDDDVVVVRPTPSTPTTQPPVVVTPPTLPPTTEESQPILKSQSFLTALIVGEILLVIIAIVIIAAVMRKRD